MTEYYSVILNADSDENLDEMLKVAMSMPSYYRIYIDDLADPNWDDNQYRVEVLFADDRDATVFHLKLV